jgi:hyperosmotically inducible periplasmic protein
MKSTIYFSLCIALGAAAFGCERASGELRPVEERREPASAPNAEPTGEKVLGDRHPSPTPIDQGNNDADLSVTQNIRKSLMDDPALTTTGKNVKIVTKNGIVTLLGAVSSAEEKASIESKAKTVAGVQRVDNQLEIETKKEGPKE